MNCPFFLEKIRKCVLNVLARIVVCNRQDFRVGVKLIINDFCQQLGTVTSLYYGYLLYSPRGEEDLIG